MTTWKSEHLLKLLPKDLESKYFCLTGLWGVNRTGNLITILKRPIIFFFNLFFKKSVFLMLTPLFCSLSQSDGISVSSSTHWKKISGSLFFFLATPCSMWNFPEQGSSLCPLHWKCGVLTTGPPGKSWAMSVPVPYPNLFFETQSTIQPKKKKKKFNQGPEN